MEAIADFMARADAANWIAAAAAIVAFLSFLGAWASFHRQAERDRRVELQENYLRLELASNELFRYEAEHGGVLAAYKLSQMPPDFRPDAASDSIADNFFLQQLNLFEIAARFRRDDVFARNIFGSWVIWYHDVATSWYFRQNWMRNYSDNYTIDLLNIFHPMIGYFEREIGDADLSSDDNDARAQAFKRVFFEHVAKVFDCNVVLDWLARSPSFAVPAPARR